MGEGYWLSYRDRAHLDDLLSALENNGVSVTRIESADEEVIDLEFRRGKGFVTGGVLLAQATPWFHLGWGHTFNPFRWPADQRLEQDIKHVLTEHGAGLRFYREPDRRV
jgi:hypothetical protein